MRSPFMRMDELSEYLRFTVRSGPRKGALDVAGARKWAAAQVKAGKLRLVPRGGGPLLVRREEVDAILNAAEVDRKTA